MIVIIIVECERIYDFESNLSFIFPETEEEESGSSSS